MELTELIKLGTPALVLGILVFLERINATVNAIRDDVNEIRRGMMWNDTCEAKHEEINRRLERIERHALDDA